MGRLFAAAATALLAASSAVAQTGTGVKCSPGSKCPSDKPCCSQYGECGVGAYCLGGCDGVSSYSLNSCVPAPVCKSNQYSLKSLDGIVDQKTYLGDASKADWVASGQPLQSTKKDSVILTLSEDGDSASGTLLASSTYVWYGKITASLKTSRGAGVVTAFILLSDNKDEIDFEFIGTDLQTAQSNYYFQGITNYENSKNITVKGADTYSDYHKYEIDWKPDQLTWAVDGTVYRTLKKSDTFNKTTNQYHYPQTPSRVQLSLWPAGISKNGKGTVDWAGGLINWQSPDYQKNKYYYAMYNEIDVQCYDAPKGAASTSGKKSYVYQDTKVLEGSVAITDNSTILKSLLGTGTDLDKDIPSQSSGAPKSTEVATIPGLSGAGPGTDGSRGDSGSSNSGGSGGSGGASQSGSANNAASTGIGGFSQGTTKGNDAPAAGGAIAGSMLAGMMSLLGVLLML